jgi:hypothetical protein
MAAHTPSIHVFLGRPLFPFPFQLIHCFSSLYTVGIPIMATDRHTVPFRQSFRFPLIIYLSTCYFSLIRVYIGFLDFVLCTWLSYVLFPSLSNSLVSPGILLFPHFQQSLLHLTQHTTIFILLSLTIYELGSLILTSMLKSCVL